MTWRYPKRKKKIAAIATKTSKRTKGRFESTLAAALLPLMRLMAPPTVPTTLEMTLCAEAFAREGRPPRSVREARGSWVARGEFDSRGVRSGRDGRSARLLRSVREVRSPCELREVRSSRLLREVRSVREARSS